MTSIKTNKEMSRISFRLDVWSLAIQTIGAKIVATLVGFTLTGALKDRISSNNSRGRLFEERKLFQIFLTGTHA